MKKTKRNNYKNNNPISIKVHDGTDKNTNSLAKKASRSHKIIIISLTFTLIFSCFSISYAGLFGGNDDLTTKITKGLTQIQEWILKIATPAAAVSIGFGLLMKKFSFGDEEKITTGKKLIRSTLFSYAFILLIDPIISAIQTLFA